MNAKQRVELPTLPSPPLGKGGMRGVVVFAGLCLSMSLGPGAAGCAEHRVGLTEFLERQRAVAMEQRAPSEQEVAPSLDKYLGPYKVGPGDVLAVDLTGIDPDDAREAPLFSALQVRVDRNGQIDLPIVGAVEVANLELEDVEDTIHQAYIPGVYKEAVCHVELVSVETTNVLVVGAVASPGLIPLRRTERNMLFAIVGAGGVSEIASGYGTLRRVRRPTEEVTLNLRDPVQLKAALTLEPLEHGDIVYVHAARPNTIFVGGLVNVPGRQDYPPGTEITVLQALAAAAGPRTDVLPKEGTLIRRMPDGTDLHLKLNLNRLAKGKDPNITLAAGDILWVPETFATRVRDFFNRNIFMRAGVSVTYGVTGVEFLNRRSLQTGRFGGGTLEDTYDPLGFLTRNTLVQGLSPQP